MSENSMSKLQRLQAEREDCINMAASCRTSFKNTLLLFRRADKLKSEIFKEVSKNAVSIQSHHATNLS
jgi:hypothetical protein